MMEIKTILMLTEKYAEKSNIASKIAWTVTPYRITLPYIHVQRLYFQSVRL